MSARLSPQREAEIAARAEAATPGPWGVYEYGGGNLIDIAADLKDTGTGYRARRTIAQLEDEPLDNDPTHREWTAEEDWAQVQADAAFIAHAPEGINALLAELAAVRAERDQLQRRFDELETLGRELLSHCTAEYGGPGYTHCELPTGHDGQHESALGHMRRATWGGEAR